MGKAPVLTAFDRVFSPAVIFEIITSWPHAASFLITAW
jgi:hypothetical protein